MPTSSWLRRFRSNTGTFTNLRAVSSGTLGTGGTNNSTTGTVVVSCADPSADDLTISSVVIDWQINASVAGVQLTAGTCTVNYQYSVDDGTNWTTFFAQTAQNGSTSSLNITTAIGGLWSRILQLRFRATGTVTSGTGLLPVTTDAN